MWVEKAGMSKDGNNSYVACRGMRRAVVRVSRFGRGMFPTSVASSNVLRRWILHCHSHSNA